MSRLPLPRALFLALAITLPTFHAVRARAAAEPTPSSEMEGAANALLAALTDDQRRIVSFEFKDEERLNWHLIPRERKGLTWKDMAPHQRHLAFALLSSGLSQRGLVKVQTIMSLEQILLEVEQGRGPKRDPENYFWSIFGTPNSKGAWGWRVEGHHLSVNFTVVDGQAISSTPSIRGSNPGEVREGPRKGLRVLGAEEDLGRELVQSLSAEQRKIAVFADKAPPELLTLPIRKATRLAPAGIPASKLSGAQKRLLHRLISEYVRTARPEVAEVELAQIEKAGFSKVHFAWAGPDVPGQGHYYRVQGPTFLIEYDNTQNNANHPHAVWREFDGDFGEDLLARHYRENNH